MKTLLPKPIWVNSPTKEFRISELLKIRTMQRSWIVLVSLILTFYASPTFAQTGTWTALSNSPPNGNNGVLLLLTDGRILCQNNTGFGWDILTPDAAGDYANGTWTVADNMDSSRTFYSSQVLADGRVFVAGGEYGTGGNSGATYDPINDLWGPELDFGQFISDACSEILPDGRVMFSPVNGNQRKTVIWNPDDNTFINGPSTNESTNEAVWIKLPDNSILTIPKNSFNSERYIPATNTWQYDGVVPIFAYSPCASETGGAVMLPDGRAYFIGGDTACAYYTPTGDATNGTWTAAPPIPNLQAAPDAAAAMMKNGNVLMCLSNTITQCGPTIFPSPASFYEFDYSAGVNGEYTQVLAPAAGNVNTINIPAYHGVMVNLPNGDILWGRRNQTQYYVYTPGSGQLNANRPIIDDIAQNNGSTFTLTGRKLNGWSEGSTYGDDWQMNSNYPIISLTDGANVYYARSYDWSCIGCISTGNDPITTDFVLPAGLPDATYDLRVIANGIKSAPVSFCVPNIDVNLTITTDISCNGDSDGAISATSINATNPTFSWNPGGAITPSISNLSSGLYTVTVTDDNGSGCAVTKSIDLPDPPVLTASAIGTTDYNGFNITCFGEDDGAATADGSGGTPPYSYLWDIPSNVKSPSGLSAGTYNVTVTDAHGCEAYANVTLTEPDPLIATISNVSDYNGFNISCNGGNDGWATVSGSGGAGTNNYVWSDGQVTQTAINLVAGYYSVSITDINGCVDYADITLTEPTPLTIEAGDNQTVYFGYPPAECADISWTGEGGGVPPYLITWSDGGSQTHEVCPGLITTTYTVTITDLNGCVETDEVTICVIDVRCGKKLDKVEMCHVPEEDPGNVQTICVSINAVEMHFSHGDLLASCGTDHSCPPLKSNESLSFAERNNNSIEAYPNPFNQSTTLEFSSVTDGNVTMKLYDVSGKELAILFNETVKADEINTVKLDQNLAKPGLNICLIQYADGSTEAFKLIFNK